MAEQSTITVYALNGTNRKFTIPFEYLARRFVTVTLLGTSRTELEITSGFRFLSANQIETTQAWGSAQGYTNIEIRRNTSATQRLVDFYDGSVLRSRDLNVSALQTIHIAEEARNMAGETLAENIDGNLDARFRKVVNVQAGTVGGDAVNYGQMVAWSDSVLNSANLAVARAAAALVSQNAAKTSETNSKTSETNALAYRNTADSHRIAAANSAASIVSDELTSGQNAAAALASKNAAASSQGAALTSQNAAKASELLAAKWAENPTNTAVTAGKYSAKHWADKAMEIVTTDYLKKASNLSDLDNIATARSNLGLGDAATATIGEGSGQVLTRESYGVGVAQFLPSPLNSALPSGTYYWDVAVANQPSTNYPLFLEVMRTGSKCIQVVTDYIGAKYQRYQSTVGGAWSAWSFLPVLNTAHFGRLVDYVVGSEAGDKSAYIFAQVLSGSSLQVGQNVSGSLLRVASGNGRVAAGFGPIAGTWRCQGYAHNPEEGTQGLCSTLFVRVL